MILYLNSVNSTNSIHHLDEATNGTYKFISFCCTNNIFNVNDTNNKIYFNENGSDLTATLTNGYYNLNDLKTNISDNMSNEMSGTLTVTLDSNTNKFTFSVGTGDNIYFKFQTNTENSARKLLGFNKTDGTGANTQTSEIPVDINVYKNIFIDITENSKKPINGENYFKTSLIINGLGGFGETFRYIENDNFSQYINLKNTKEIKINIHDDNNNEINLNSEYIIILKKC